MPAFAAHILIAKDILPALNISDSEDNQKYFLLGSLGPDLPYYKNVFGSAIGTYFEEKYNPQSPGYYTGHADYFHSLTPNLFPMKMLEVIKKDKDSSTELKKLSFTMGYLTHVAADHHIHPVVEYYAGPFYSSGISRNRHRTLEVYQDLFLYNEKYPKKAFFQEDFRSWVEIGPPAKKSEKKLMGTEVVDEAEPLKIYTPDWFRSFIQRSFLETYAVIMDSNDIEKWVAGFHSIFQHIQDIGPYRKADEEIKRKSREADTYQQLFKAEHKYMKNCFEPAKSLSQRYINAAQKFFETKMISAKERKEFLSKVSDADLTSPLVDL